ncbi:MAG: hypothetical protein JO001_16430 [Alphaproteobacteria bacterium]|nr:hypothetical protein [Alphaproteobacteria bacterium]
MNVAVKLQSVRPVSQIVISSTERDIRDFLNGKNNGEDLLHAMYDDILDEAVPERLLAVLRG